MFKYLRQKPVFFIDKGVSFDQNQHEGTWQKLPIRK